MIPKKTFSFAFGKSFLILLLGLQGSIAMAQATCPSAPGRFAPTGDQVLDRYTGLVWQRCSQGQTWSGSDCAGTATTHTLEQAMIVAGQAVPGAGLDATATYAGAVAPGTAPAAAWYAGWTSFPEN